MPNIELEEITTTQALERLYPEWSTLWACCPTATPFQSPEWLIPWWRHIGAGELWTLALRCAGRLIGLVPFYIYVGPGSSERRVFLVGVATSDYLDALFLSDFASRGAAAALAHLETARQRWDVCDLQQLRPGSPLLQTPVPLGWEEELLAQEACPVLALPAAVEDFHKRMPVRLLKNIRYAWRRAEQHGPVRMERADQDNLGELLESLLRLHGARWSARGLTGVLASEDVQIAHREAAPGLLSRGVLRLYGLRLAGRIVACLYGFTTAEAGRGRAYFYLGGFDPAFAHLSVGTLVIDHAIREAVREGATEFDFLRGREGYKYRWGAQDRQTYRRLLRHPSSGSPPAPMRTRP